MCFCIIQIQYNLFKRMSYWQLHGHIVINILFTGWWWQQCRGLHFALARLTLVSRGRLGVIVYCIWGNWHSPPGKYVVSVAAVWHYDVTARVQYYNGGRQPGQCKHISKGRGRHRRRGKPGQTAPSYGTTNLPPQHNPWTNAIESNQLKMENIKMTYDTIIRIFCFGPRYSIVGG